jgi:hypothetical protein
MRRLYGMISRALMVVHSTLSGCMFAQLQLHSGHDSPRSDLAQFMIHR